VPRIAALADRERGTDVNVGVIAGGTRFNVVAAEAECQVGVRVKTHAEAERVTAALADLKPAREGASITVGGGLLWPPMEPNEATDDLARQAIALADELGFDLTAGHAGGSSDGCHCAAAGATVLDGLGAVGAGAHANHEHVLIPEIPRRIALLVRLLEATASRA
jgi:glutamate carboxypeptidase